MKNNYKDYLIITISLLFLYFSIINNKLINTSILSSINLWITKVFPSLFPMILINNILIDYNFPYYITKIFKKKGLKYYVMTLSLFSGSPSNAIIIKELFQNNTINETDANKLLTYTFFSNPIFLVTMLSLLFELKIVSKIIIISYISNFIISFFFKINPSNIKQSKNKKHSISNSINKTMSTLIMILGTIVFYILFSTFIITLFKFNDINSLFIKGFLELTQGLNELQIININLFLKQLIALIFISFGGLSIHAQIKSILSDTNLYYKYFLYGRLLSIIISVIILTFIALIRTSIPTTWI